MNIRLWIGAIVGAIALAVSAYFFGYRNAQTKGELAMESLKNAQAEAVIAAQLEVKNEYEKRVKELADSLDRVKRDNSNRMQQLKRFEQSERTLEACLSDRAKLARLATEGEQLLREIEQYIRAERGESDGKVRDRQ